MASGFGYTPVESLLCKTPVIITPCDAFLEIGITSENAIITDWNLDNINVNDIYEKRLKVNYEPPKSNWDKFLYHGSNTYKNGPVKMKATRYYTDSHLGRDIECDEEIEAEDETRAIDLINAGVAKYET